MAMLKTASAGAAGGNPFRQPIDPAQPAGLACHAGNYGINYIKSAAVGHPIAIAPYNQRGETRTGRRYDGDPTGQHSCQLRADIMRSSTGARKSPASYPLMVIMPG